MLRGLLFLIIVGIAAYIIVTLVRRTPRRRESARPHEAEPAPAPTAPALAPPADAGTLTHDQVLHKLNELAFSRELKSNTPAHREVIEAVGTVLETAATDPRYAPRRPMLLPQLLRAVNDTETSRRELATLIAKDPALVGSLLKLANSQFYRVNAQPVESVDRAVAVIGTEGIRSLIAAALVQPVFRVSGGDFGQFPEVIWDHTFLAANAAETYAAVVVNSDPFAAQLLALLNGLGAIVVFRMALDQYAARSLLKPDAATIIAVLDLHSARVARNIAASWDLSGRILAALEDQVPTGMALDPTPLGRALRFGRFVGALAVLNAKGVITDDAARAALLANGASGAHFERIWERLTGKPAKAPEKKPPATAWSKSR
ncbi:MAG TPA: HDOD domain-containing protein [Steroidobacteraceae bacterium]|jgi:HD-like signal output (HDOD) protein|nr:HDOD domain-containing protein [Steroidobacteraceae bacterium]